MHMATLDDLCVDKQKQKPCVTKTTKENKNQLTQVIGSHHYGRHIGLLNLNALHITTINNSHLP